MIAESCAISESCAPSRNGARCMIAATMLSTNSPVIVGAEPASPQPTTPPAFRRTSTLSAVVSTPLERLIGRVSGRLTAIGSTRCIFNAGAYLRRNSSTDLARLPSCVFSGSVTGWVAPNVGTYAECLPAPPITNT